MSLLKNEKSYIGPISYIPPRGMESAEDSDSKTSYFFIDNRENDFEICMEACYSREDAKTYLSKALEDEEIEPIGQVTPFALQELTGYYLDYYLPQYKNVYREFCFDLHDEDFNFFSILINVNCTFFTSK